MKIPPVEAELFLSDL